MVDVKSEGMDGNLQCREGRKENEWTTDEDVCNDKKTERRKRRIGD